MPRLGSYFRRNPGRRIRACAAPAALPGSPRPPFSTGRSGAQSDGDALHSTALIDRKEIAPDHEVVDLWPRSTRRPFCRQSHAADLLDQLRRNFIAHLAAGRDLPGGLRRAVRATPRLPLRTARSRSGARPGASFWANRTARCALRPAGLDPRVRLHPAPSRWARSRDWAECRVRLTHPRASPSR